MDDPTRDDMLAFLNTQTCGEDISFDIEEAIYWFAADYHEGQWSNLYSALSTSEFRPGRSSSGPEDTWLYDMLVEEFGQ